MFRINLFKLPLGYRITYYWGGIMGNVLAKRLFTLLYGKNNYRILEVEVLACFLIAGKELEEPL